MKLSEFQQAVDQEFGAAYGAVVVGDVGLEAFGGRSAADALDAGAAPRDVWAALCAAMDVPLERRHGPVRRERGERRG